MSQSREMFGRCAAIFLFAAAAVGPLRVGAAANAEKIARGWPEPSRLQARAMIEKYGNPDRRDEASMTWFGLFGGRRTVVHRAEPGELLIEQAVLYRVPAAKVGDLTSFDPRITVSRKTSEMSVRTDSVKTNLLTLNLAHEIASGFKTVDEARDFRDKQMRLAEAGKTSRYRESLIFEKPPKSLPSPFVLPAGVNPPPRRPTEP